MAQLPSWGCQDAAAAEVDQDLTNFTAQKTFKKKKKVNL
jgi:hypothetical protein